MKSIKEEVGDGELHAEGKGKGKKRESAWTPQNYESLEIQNIR